MCDICLQNPCHDNCPNAPYPPIFGECENCGAEIYDGDDYYEVEEKPYCEACMHSFWKTARVER